MQPQVVIVGAGMGGLVAACLLGRAGVQVQLLEAAATVGGKAQQVEVGGHALDVGPSVLTLRHVFDDVFAACGERLDEHLTLRRLPQLARHVWAPGAHANAGASAAQTLDLYADAEQTADAVGVAFGRKSAREYLAFAAYAERLYHAAQTTFVYGPKPTYLGALRAFGSRVLRAPWEMDSRRSMWQALQAAFPTTPALVQLYARYATYCGASPLHAPATLNLVSHVERLGVWGIAGGISALAQALAALARRQGVVIRCNSQVDGLRHDAAGRVCGVVLADGSQLTAQAVVLAGALRPEGSPRWARRPPQAGGLWRTPAQDDAARRPMAVGLSADVAGLVAEVAPDGFVPSCHNVFFFGDSREEFGSLFARRRRPAAPTVYLCAPDRAIARNGVAEAPPVGRKERLFVLTNAPPARRAPPPEEQQAWIQRTCARLAHAGLQLRRTHSAHLQGPHDFARRFPGTDGVLYGPPPHSWNSFFTRPGSRTPWPQCYAAGGLTHPGPGVPMAALSGRQAALALLQDFPSLARCRPAATPGGTSTAKVTTASTS